MFLFADFYSVKADTTEALFKILTNSCLVCYEALWEMMFEFPSKETNAPYVLTGNLSCSNFHQELAIICLY